MKNQVTVTYDGHVVINWKELPISLTAEEIKQLMQYLQLALDNIKEIRVQKLNKLLED